MADSGIDDSGKSRPDDGAEGAVAIALLTATFDARTGAEDALLAALSNYVVMTRREAACRNVDLVASVTRPGRCPRHREVGIGGVGAVPPGLSTDDRHGESGTGLPRVETGDRSLRPDLCLRSRIAGAPRAESEERLLPAEKVDRDLGGAALVGAGLLADLADAVPRDPRVIPAPFEGGVGDIGEAVLQAEVVELTGSPDVEAEARRRGRPRTRPRPPARPAKARRRAARRQSRRRADPLPAAP